MSRKQLRALGMSDKQIARDVEAGRLHELHVDVWAVGHPNISPTGHLIAALLSCGPRSFLSHRTAAAVLGLRRINIRAIEVTIVGARAVDRERLTVHRTAKEPDAKELRTRGLLRFSSFARMLVELAPTETDDELDRLVTEGVRRRLYDPDAVERALDRHRRRPGMRRLQQAVARYRPQNDRKSELEHAFDAWLADNPDIPPPLTNVIIDGWEIDCWWPEQRVAVELDGRPYHVAAKDMDKDRLKDVRLQLIDIRVMRVTDFGFAHDRSGVKRHLLGLLQLG